MITRRGVAKWFSLTLRQAQGPRTKAQGPRERRLTERRDGYGAGAGRRDRRTKENDMALTAHSTIGEWLNDPTGGELIKGLLAQTGADPAQLTPVLGLPLQQLVAMSQGAMPQSVVDDLVRAANGGEIPEDAESTGWVEKDRKSTRLNSSHVKSSYAVSCLQI